jgi:nitronate monooxygenase
MVFDAATDTVRMRTPSNRRRQADLDCALAHRVELLIASVGNPAALGLVLLTAGAGGQAGWLNPLAFLRAVREHYDGTVVLAGGIADGTALWAA